MEDTNGHITAYKTYVFIWAALLVLTAITIAVGTMHFTSYSVLICLAIASIKALLVLIYFMHMRYESLFLRSVVFLALLALTTMIGLTFVDVWYR